MIRIRFFASGVLILRTSLAARYWCNTKVAQKKGLQFYQNTIQCGRPLQHFTCDVDRESGFHEVRRRIVQQSASVSKITAKKAVLKPNLYHGRLDAPTFEARTSVDHQSKESEEYGETRGDSNRYRGTEEFSETRDFKMQGLPHSTVQKHDDTKQSRN